ncbi:uncharacterized protein EAF01_000148 [Botrytis porri]|uniref:uncharacterized protein n=1 Tax=Botrytis porri TaxID=87229 RepID=UPI0018FF28E2|nr:uncharacterized protein EAF01_000148 [Botrytis porri]KAF7913742.1 hypothetical protein EAF01_000148 [Botrytis porri]
MSSPKRPNFLVIVADDLGFSDLSCFGGEISTPNIDKIAQARIRYTDFHAAAACSPSRAMIVTGTDHHIAGLGNLIEWTNISGQNDPSGKMSTAPQRGMPGYEGYLIEKVATLPEILRDDGYMTLVYLISLLLVPHDNHHHDRVLLKIKLTHSDGQKMVPWSDPRAFPKSTWVERSFAHLPACSNHYGYEPQLHAPDQIPEFMTMSFIAFHSEDGECVKKLPEDWYSSNGYGDKMLEYLKEKNEKKDERPFFGYFPFTAPHWPLQAPPEFVEKYKGVYDAGPDALHVEPHPVVADEVKEWNDLTAEEKAKSCRAIEVFAAMVECIDYNVGHNGAEGAAYEAYPIVQGSMIQHLQKYYNNSLENLGNGDSFIWYGSRWAQAATASSRLYKAYTTEGGVRIPFVAQFPSSFNTHTTNSITHNFATVMDLAPTILEMAGTQHPALTYQGREIVHMRGKSMLPFISGTSPRIHAEDFISGWETCDRAALRKGSWKIVSISKLKGTEKWQLCNLSVDPGEIHDLADAQPEKLKDLIKLWDGYVLETGVVPLAPELGNWLKATEE